MERNLAVLIDFENIATGCEKEGLGRFDVRIVMRRLKDKGRITVGRSYADWGRWSRFKLDLVHEGITMCELTSHGMQSKNRADIALAVDAMELAYTRSYIDTFVILSGDSDFTPLVMRLKELNKRVIGCGTRRSTSRLIAETCDEFFFYDTLRDESRIVPAKKPSTAREAAEEEEEEPLTMDEATELLVETLENLQRDEPGAVHASVLKASMKRKEPTFSEVELGVRTFASFLEALQQKGVVRLFRDERAGGFRVDFPQSAPEEIPAPPPRREPVRTLSPDAQRLQGLLAEAGLEIGEPRERRIIVEQFVAVCAERARRNRTCAVQFVLGDLLRRTKQEAPDIAPRTVKAVTHALRRAGLLIHPNGEAALSATAPFVAPESAPQLLDELHAAGLRVIEARGENPDDTVLTELFVGADGVPYQAPEGHEAPEERAAEGREERRDERRDDRREERREERREAGRAPAEKPREERAREEGGREERGRGRRGGRGRGGRRGEDGEPSTVAIAQELGWPALIGEPLPLAVEPTEAPVEAPRAEAPAAREARAPKARAEAATSAEPKPKARGEAAAPSEARAPKVRAESAEEPKPKARGEAAASGEARAPKARAEAAAAEAPAEAAEPAAEKPARRTRSRKKPTAEEAAPAEDLPPSADEAPAPEAAASDADADEAGDDTETAESGDAPAERRRRRRGGRRGRRPSGGSSEGGGTPA